MQDLFMVAGFFWMALYMPVASYIYKLKGQQLHFVINMQIYQYNPVHIYYLLYTTKSTLCDWRIDGHMTYNNTHIYSKIRMRGPYYLKPIFDIWSGASKV